MKLFSLSLSVTHFSSWLVDPEKLQSQQNFTGLQRHTATAPEGPVHATQSTYTHWTEPGAERTSSCSNLQLFIDLMETRQVTSCLLYLSCSAQVDWAGSPEHLGADGRLTWTPRGGWETPGWGRWRAEEEVGSRRERAASPGTPSRCRCCDRKRVLTSARSCQSNRTRVGQQGIMGVVVHRANTSDRCWKHLRKYNNSTTSRYLM